ncbi:unnamed protein product [Urochloa decumbens]|uniref:F-box domain-containing protein n=1 Tax=Urochloa decumbens TaxID=240449 RepID=A0ABC9G8K1_9POAL
MQDDQEFQSPMIGDDHRREAQQDMEEQPRIRSRRDSQGSALPTDLLYDILLRLPGQDLCRLRAVCRPWRSLLSDRDFIADHAARHPEPLIVVGYEALRRNRLALCDIMDHSGRVVKRIHAGAELDRVMYTHLGLLCVTIGGSGMRFQLLNPATGDVHALPEGLAAEHAVHRQALGDCWATTAFGLVPSTGEYKVLRLLYSFGYRDHPPRKQCDVFSHAESLMKLYEVFTVGGSGQARWRGKKAPPYNFELDDRNSVVIKHVIYFLLSDYDSGYGRKDLVASFDLETEKWSASIQGPLSDFMRSRRYDFKLAALGEGLVLGCRRPSFSIASPSMDLWILRDFEKGLWVKQYSIEISFLHVRHLVQPLLVLNDGMIANRTGNWAFLTNYIAVANTYTDVLKRNHSVVAVGLYGGSILSLASSTTKR